MTLKEELEILRGEPIEFLPKPEEIPCVETSDPEKLCKHPIVSVHMITYNHEPYIRQAIEGVMMQKTDFEFELVIGEDASTDKTREICFEYQKRYPDKIRVLWSEHNVNVGPNLTRVTARCRGEFIAYCEGDDYWIDPRKLQKQVDVMRRHPNVSLVFCGAKLLDNDTGEMTRWNEGQAGYAPGMIPSRQYCLWTMFGKHPPNPWGPEYFVMTATLMIRTSTFCHAAEKYDIVNWRLWMGDSVLCLANGAVGDVYYLSDDVAVYRRTRTGVTHTNTEPIAIDTLLVRLYMLKVFFKKSPEAMPGLTEKGLRTFLLHRLSGFSSSAQRSYICRVMRLKQLRCIYTRWTGWLSLVVLCLGALNSFTYRWLIRIDCRLPHRKFPHELRKLYEEL